MSGTEKADRARLVLVTGLSGSGKSTVANCFEDLGYHVVETPIRFEDRVAGASKVSQGEVRRALWTVLRLSLRR